MHIQNKIYSLFSIFVMNLLIISYSFSKDGLKIIYSGPDKISLEYSPVLNNLQQMKNADGELFINPIIERTNPNFSSENLPLEKFFKVSILIPEKDGFEVESSEVFEGKKIDGFLPLSSFSTNNNNLLFDKNKIQIPNTKWVDVKYSGIARSHYTAEVIFKAVSWNSETNKIEIPSKINITIKYKLKEISQTPITSDDFFIKQYINSEIGKNWAKSYNELNKFNQDLKSKSSKIQGGPKLSDGDWFKIEIPEDGVYTLDAQTLKNAGINISNDKIGTIKIFGKGSKRLNVNLDQNQINELNQQAITVKTNSDGSLANITFYAAGSSGFEYRNKYGTTDFYHYISPFNANNYYLLTYGGDLGLRANTQEKITNEADLKPSFYTHRIFFEEEITNVFPEGSGLQFIGRNYFGNSILNDLPDLIPNSDIKYRFSLVNKSGDNATFNIFQSGDTLLENISLGGIYSTVFGTRAIRTITHSSSQIKNNKSSINFNYKDASGISSNGYLDYFEIHFQRPFKALNNELTFFCTPNDSGIVEYDVNGFNGNYQYIFDVTKDANPILIDILNPNSSFKVNINKNLPRRFFVSSNFKSAKISKISFSNLRENLANKDVILITPSSLIESAKKLKEYRESRSNLKFEIVNIEDIQNEFGYCTNDFAGLRNYISYSVNKWDVIRPKYVILFGKGHFDFRNIQSTTPNLMPPFESDDDSDTFSEISSTCTDDFFGRVVGDDNKIDISVSRIAVSNSKEADTVISKIKYYENNSSTDRWRTTITLVADDSPSGGTNFDRSMHTDQSEGLARDKIPTDMMQNKIYLVEYPTVFVGSGTTGRSKPACAADLISTVNTGGNLILNWIGHGNPKVWAHETIFQKDITVPQMANKDKLFFLTAATCDFGKFDVPEMKSGTEELFLSPIGGAIAVFSSTRVVIAQFNSDINNELYRNMFLRDSITGEYPTIGEALYTVKQQYYDDNSEKYYLLGDPTMSLLLPKKVISIDEINGSSTNDSKIKIKALQEFTIKGRILNEKGGSIANNFSGKIYLSLFDGDRYIKKLDVDGTPFNFTKYGGLLNRSSYKVENGYWEAKVVLPKDISFSENTGRIFGYALTNDEKDYAKGAFTKIFVDGIQTTSTKDDTGPEIKLYLDSRDYKDGDIVRNKPLLMIDLFDETGINSTGFGIGRKIEAWIDDSPNSIDFSDKYTSSNDDYRKGTASDYLITFLPGLHKVKVRAWDLYNNFSIAQTEFRVNNTSDVNSGNFENVPNPFNDQTEIKFKHNLNPPFNLTIKIYTINGQQVRELNSICYTPLSSSLIWDGKDSQGRIMNPGSYIYNIFVQNNETGYSHLGGGIATLVK